MLFIVPKWHDMRITPQERNWCMRAHYCSVVTLRIAIQRNMKGTQMKPIIKTIWPSLES